ncbi:MAG: TetR family transcriptional regulator [Pseudomonadota bacterium]
MADLKHSNTTVKREALTLGSLAKNAGTAKGAYRVASIIEATRSHILRKGHGAVTLEAVAELVGIRKGNLQYYFPTRSDLLCATFAAEIESHSQEWIAARDAQNDGARSRLNRVVAFELESNRNAEFIAQVRERWSLEERDERARELTEKWYAWITEKYAELIAGIRPELKHEQRLEIAAVIYSLVVGSTPYFSNELWRSNYKTEIDRTIMKAIDVILSELSHAS